MQRQRLRQRQETKTKERSYPGTGGANRHRDRESKAIKEAKNWPHPMVVMKELVKESSAKRSSRHDLPTPAAKAQQAACCFSQQLLPMSLQLPSCVGSLNSSYQLRGQRELSALAVAGWPHSTGVAGGLILPQSVPPHPCGPSI